MSLAMLSGTCTITEELLLFAAEEEVGSSFMFWPTVGEKICGGVPETKVVVKQGSTGRNSLIISNQKCRKSEKKDVIKSTDSLER